MMRNKNKKERHLKKTAKKNTRNIIIER